MGGFFTRVWALARKESLHVVRDRQVIYLALGLPLMMVLLFGYAVSFDVDQIPVAIVDHAHDRASRTFIGAVRASEQFHLVAQPRRSADLAPMFRRGAIKIAVVVPPDFSRQLLRRQSPALQLLVDGADGTTANVAMSYLRGLARSLDLAPGSAAGPRLTLPLGARVRTMFNPRMRSALFIVPGLAAAVLAILSVLLSTITVAREWERGSMEQLFATPVGRLAIVAGKLLPYVVLGGLQLLLVLSVGVWLFDVPVRGSVALLALASVLFQVGVLSQGLLISVITKSQQVATQVGAVSAILPALLLSGFIFPIENMPKVLQVLSHIVPTRYMVAALRGILLQGRSFAELAPQFLGMGIFAVVMVTICTVKFRRRLD